MSKETQRDTKRKKCTYPLYKKVMIMSNEAGIKIWRKDKSTRHLRNSEVT